MQAGGAWGIDVSPVSARLVGRMVLASPSEEEILQLVAERESLRQSRRFSESDAIREQLRSMGVELYDKEREWRSRDGRRGELFTAGPVGCSLSDAEIHEYIVQREDARTTKDWSKADSLRDELRRQGVELDDRSRSWRTSTGRSGTYSGHTHSSASTLSETEIRYLVAERERARAAQDFATADSLRLRLLRMGVELFDSERTWKTNDGRQGVIVTGGTEIVQCTIGDAEIRARIHAREEARSQKDWDRADAIRDELRRLGVELIDMEQKWRTTDGRTGAYALPAQWSGINATIVQAAQQTMLKFQEQYASMQQTGQISEEAFNAAAQAYLVAAQAQGAMACTDTALTSLDTGSVAGALPGNATLSDASIQALVAGREAGRESQDLETAEAIQLDLLQHGVELDDEQNAWVSSDGRQGFISSVVSHLGCSASALRSAPVLQQVVAAVNSAKTSGLPTATGRGAMLMGAGLPISADLAAVLALAGRI